MPLTCSCDYDYDFDHGEWYYWYANSDESFQIPFAGTKRKRCCSCNNLIEIGEICNKYPRYRYPHDEIESQIKTGRSLDDAMCDEATIRIADHYHCEKCSEIWLNLTDIGYECLSPSENMVEKLKEYWELTGFDTNNYLHKNENNGQITHTESHIRLL